MFNLFKEKLLAFFGHKGGEVPMGVDPFAESPEAEKKAPEKKETNEERRERMGKELSGGRNRMVQAYNKTAKLVEKVNNLPQEIDMDDNNETSKPKLLERFEALDLAIRNNDLLQGDAEMTAIEDYEYMRNEDFSKELEDLESITKRLNQLASDMDKAMDVRSAEALLDEEEDDLA